MSTKNYKHVDLPCPECEGIEVLFDPIHGETFCDKCGLVIQDTILINEQLVDDDEQKKPVLVRNILVPGKIIFKEAETSETKK